MSSLGCNACGCEHNKITAAVFLLSTFRENLPQQQIVHAVVISKNRMKILQRIQLPVLNSH